MRRPYTYVRGDTTEAKRAIHIYEECGFKEYDRNNVDVFMEITKPYLIGKFKGEN